MKPARLEQMSEDDLLTAVIDLAQAAGFVVTHFRPLRTKQTRNRKRDGREVEIWKTAVQGDKGWVDLAIAGHGRFLTAECKNTTGTLTEDERRWKDELEAARVEYHLWRPRDWEDGSIAKALGCEGGVIDRGY